MIGLLVQAMQVSKNENLQFPAKVHTSGQTGLHERLSRIQDAGLPIRGHASGNLLSTKKREEMWSESHFITEACDKYDSNPGLVEKGDDIDWDWDWAGSESTRPSFVYLAIP